MFSLENYVENLMENQNNVVCLEQMNLYSKTDYYEILKPVIDVINNNPDASIEELRNKLYEMSPVEDKVKSFILERQMAPGMVIKYGTKNFEETIVIGNRQEVGIDESGNLVPAIEKMTDDTIFDLASITKIYTGLSIIKLVEKGIINLEDQVQKYVPEFKNLKDVTIMDLLTFNKPLKTNGRIDRAKSYSEALEILNNIEVDYDSIGSTKNPYTDMGAMVLKFVIEKVINMSFYDFIDKAILQKLGLTDTHVLVPSYKLDRVASTNLERKYYEDGNIGITKDVLKSISHDPKARIMGQPLGNLSGHAGLFSTAKDMTVLAKGIINGNIISMENVLAMSENKTGRKYIDNGEIKYVQYLGRLCYSKNPHLASSEVFHALSGRTFASAGFTGNQLTVDPINNLYFFMAGNRTHNRFSYIHQSQRDLVIEDSITKRKTVPTSDGDIVDATRFAWDRDAKIVHPIIILTLQYKLLEDIFNYNKDIEDTKTHSL